MRPAVFLDRDGTLIEDHGFLESVDGLTLFPWTAAAVRKLNDAGLAVVVISNQSGVARGMFDESFVRATHDVLSARLQESGAHVDAYYYCPHLPDGANPLYRMACVCRKPAP